MCVINKWNHSHTYRKNTYFKRAPHPMASQSSMSYPLTKRNPTMMLQSQCPPFCLRIRVHRRRAARIHNKLPLKWPLYRPKMGPKSPIPNLILSQSTVSCNLRIFQFWAHVFFLNVHIYWIECIYVQIWNIAAAGTIFCCATANTE